MRVRALIGMSLIGLLVSCGNEFQDRDLHNHNAEIERLKLELKEARDRKDPIRAGELQFQMNLEEELRTAGTDASEQGRIKRKYALLEIVLKDEIKEFQEQNELLYNPYWLPGIVYHPLALKQVDKVFKDFGPLYVGETLDEEGKPAFRKVESERRPWAGFWYPFTDQSLYKGKNSPLAKFDAVMRKKGKSSHVASGQLKRFEAQKFEGWEGHCPGRAIAAALVPEPTANMTIEGIEFSIADQKGLHTFSHLQYPHSVYGIVYRGDADTDGTYQDLAPEAVHQLVTKVLGEEKRALVIDHIAGTPVWMEPLYSYRWKIEKHPQYDFAYKVSSRALLVKERSGKETDTLTGSEDIMAPAYEYTLYVDKQDCKDGVGCRVLAGRWEGRSRKDHPDTVSYLHKAGAPKSNNTSFDKNISFYQSLFINLSSPIQ